MTDLFLSSHDETRFLFVFATPTQGLRNQPSGTGDEALKLRGAAARDTVLGSSRTRMRRSEKEMMCSEPLSRDDGAAQYVGMHARIEGPTQAGQDAKMAGPNPVALRVAVPLALTSHRLQRIYLGLGWKHEHGERIDVDCACCAYDAAGVRDEASTVWFGRLRNGVRRGGEAGSSIVHTGDVLQGQHGLGALVDQAREELAAQSGEALSTAGTWACCACADA
eukprot:4282761-Pleurochrysis_carterae.AAC.1